MSELTLIIGNQNYSSWSLRPWLFLRYHKIPFQEKKVWLYTPQMEQQLALYFSNSKVPVLQHEGRTIWDSLAVLEYLAEFFHDKRGWPVDVEARAVARSVCAEMHSSFFDLRSELPMNCRRRFYSCRFSPVAQQDIDRIQGLWRHCRENFADNGPWLFGEFGIADCMYAPVVLRFLGYSVELDDVCQSYVQQLFALPAVQEWMRLGQKESAVLDEEEAEWPSKPWLLEGSE